MFKKLDRVQQEYSENLKKNLNLFAGLPSSPNIRHLEKYLFKLGDVMGELAQEDFPFSLKEDVHFTIMDVKQNVANFTIEIEAPRSYHVTYSTKHLSLELAIAYNEKEEKAIIHSLVADALSSLLATKGIDKNVLVDDIFNKVSKMISIITSPNYCLKHEWPDSFKNLTREIGKVNLVTTKHKNMLFTCDAYPYFYNIEWGEVKNGND